MRVLGTPRGAATCVGAGSAPSPAHRGAGPLPGVAAHPEPWGVRLWGRGGAGGLCLAPGRLGRGQVVGAEPLHPGKGLAHRQQAGGSVHGQDAGE